MYLGQAAVLERFGDDSPSMLWRVLKKSHDASTFIERCFDLPLIRMSQTREGLCTPPQRLPTEADK